MSVSRRVIPELLLVVAVGSAGCSAGHGHVPPAMATATASSPSSEPSQSAAAQSAFPPGTVGVLDCDGTEQVRPTSIIFACADGAYQLTEISWTRWTDEQAVGTATEDANDCVPNCAQGTFHHRPVSVVLSSPRALADGSAGYYTQATISRGPGEPARVLTLPAEPTWRP
jgi:hypothetical protein